MTYMSPKLPHFTDAMAEIYGKNGSAVSSYMCAAIGGERQEKYFSPLGVLLSILYSRFAWTFQDMRGLEEYLRRVNVRGSGAGHVRLWDISIYSEQIRDRVYNGILSNGVLYDEWSFGYF